MATARSEWPLWSTTARLVVTSPQLLDRAVALADRELAVIDEAVSRFRSDSELSRIAPLLPTGVEVSPTLALFVRRALDAAELTDGDVDPTLGYAMDAIGYDRDIRLVLDGDEPIRAIVSHRPGWRSVRLNGNHLTVPAHLALDLGATAKALAADIVASRVSRVLGCGVLLSLGGDISTAGAAPGGSWDVFVQDLPSDPADRITLPGRFAIATSSTQKRRWRRAHDAVHHILDPRTGRPADPHWRSVTVIAPRCTLANTLATSAVVRGSGALAMLESHGVPARLVAHDGTVVHTDRWAWSDFAKAV